MFPSLPFLFRKMLILGILALGLTSTFPADASHSPDSCDYYDKLESQTNCGLEGYVQQFAKPYCEVYLQHRRDFSPEAQKILRDIRVCLQNHLRFNSAGMSCGQIKQYGESSHIDCYIQNGFCQLEGTDFLQVLWMARREITNLQILSMIINVHRSCGFIFSFQ